MEVNLDQIFKQYKINKEQEVNEYKSAFWKEVCLQKNKKQFSSDMLEGIELLLSDDSDVSKEAANSFGIKYSKKKFNAFNNLVNDEKNSIEITINEKEVNFLSLLYISKIIKDDVQLVLKGLIKEEGKQIGELYFLPDLDNPLVQDHVDKISEQQSGYFNFLKEQYFKALENPIIRKASFISVELQEISKLLNSSEKKNNWDYLINCTDFSKELLDQINYYSKYVARGNHLASCFHFNEDEFRLWGTIEAFMDYYEFLKKEHAQFNEVALNEASTNKTDLPNKPVTKRKASIKPKHIIIKIKSEEIKKIIYNRLNGVYFDVLEYQDFAEHHEPSQNGEFRKMIWLGMDVEIAIFYRELRDKRIISNNNYGKLVSLHYVKENGDEYDPHCLVASVVPTKGVDIKNYPLLYDTLIEIEKLIEGNTNEA